MDDLVKRSDVINAIHERNEELLQHEEYRNKRGDIDLLGLIPKINCIRPVEVESKHGKWIWDKENDKMYCSKCGYETDNWGVHQESDPIEWQLPNYCENCGTRMDGGENG